MLICLVTTGGGVETFVNGVPHDKNCTVRGAWLSHQKGGFKTWLYQLPSLVSQHLSCFPEAFQWESRTRTMQMQPDQIYAACKVCLMESSVLKCMDVSRGLHGASPVTNVLPGSPAQVHSGKWRLRSQEEQLAGASSRCDWFWNVPGACLTRASGCSARGVPQ